jgi:hypothetical protein
MTERQDMTSPEECTQTLARGPAALGSWRSTRARTSSVC